MELSIIIINWNSSDFVRECLRSVYANPPTGVFEILVVDNGSFDGCEQMLRSEFPDVGYTQSKENVGFSRANNLGSAGAAGEYLLFLNPDTVVLPNALSQLIEAAKSLPNCGILGANLLNTDRSIQTSSLQSFPTILNQLLDSDALRRRFSASDFWGTAALFNGAKSPSPVDAISGACMLLRRDVFERAGRFSVEYFMYSEDVDLCYKVHLLNLQNYFVPSATIVHHGGGSSKNPRRFFFDVMMRDARWRYFRKFRGAPYALAYRISLGVFAIGRCLVSGVAGIFAKASKDGPSWANAARKWWAIFCWALLGMSPDSPAVSKK